MSKSAAWKAKRAHSIKGRMEWTKNELRKIGIYDFKEVGVNLLITYRGHTVRYSPFTGGFTGKGIESGRGFENMLAVL